MRTTIEALNKGEDLCDEIIKKYQTVPKIREHYGQNIFGKALYLCGEFHCNMSKFECAIIYFNSLKKHHAAIAYYRIAHCNVLLGKFKEAIENFTTIIEQYADDSVDYEFTGEPGEDVISLSYFCRGVCYGELNEYQNAIDDLTNYMNITQSGFHLLDVLGRRSLMFEKKGQVEEAYQDIRTRTFLHESHKSPNKEFLAMSYRSMGCLLLRLNRYEQALVNYKKSSELNPNDPEPCKGASFSLVQLGNLEKALFYMKRAIELEAFDKNDLQEIVELWEKQLSSKE